MHRILCLPCSGSISYGLYHIRWVVLSHFEAIYVNPCACLVGACQEVLWPWAWWLITCLLMHRILCLPCSGSISYGLYHIRWAGFSHFEAIYDKSLCLSGWSLSGGSITMGQITNHMSVNAQSLLCSGSISYGLYHIRWVVFSHFEAIYVNPCACLVGACQEVLWPWAR